MPVVGLSERIVLKHSDQCEIENYILNYEYSVGKTDYLCEIKTPSSKSFYIHPNKVEKLVKVIQMWSKGQKDQMSKLSIVDDTTVIHKTRLKLSISPKVTILEESVINERACIVCDENCTISEDSFKFVQQYPGSLMLLPSKDQDQSEFHVHKRCSEEFCEELGKVYNYPDLLLGGFL